VAESGSGFGLRGADGAGGLDPQVFFGLCGLPLAVGGETAERGEATAVLGW
jgi:hypothetical protein